MSRGVKIPWVRVSKYYGWVRYTMDKGVNIPWVGGQNAMSRRVNIPWVGWSIYHG